MLTFTYLFSTESTAPALHWQSRTDGGSCPKMVLFRFSSMEQLYFCYSPGDLHCVLAFSGFLQNQSWGRPLIHFPKPWGFPSQGGVSMHLRMRLHLHQHCQRNIDPSTALTLPRHSPTKNIKAMPEQAPHGSCSRTSHVLNDSLWNKDSSMSPVAECPAAVK